MCKFILTYFLILISFSPRVLIASNTTIDSINVLIKQSSDDSLKIRLYLKLGKIYQSEGQSSEQLNAYLKANKIALDYKNNELIADTYYSLGIFFNRREENEKAIEYCRLSLSYYKKINDSIGVGAATHRLGLSLYSLNQLDSAQFYLQISYEIRKKIGGKYPIAAISNALGLVALEKKELKNALKLFKIAYQIWKELEDDEGISIASGNIGEVFSLENKIDSALFYNMISIDFSKKANAYVFLKNSYRSVEQLYKNSNQSDSAYKYLNLYLETDKIIFNSESESKIIEMQEKFNSLENKNKILEQSNQLKEQHNQKIFLIGIIIFGLFLLLIIFIFLRKINNKNLILQSKQIEIAEKNEELNQQNEEILSISEQVETQNLLLKNKNTEIIDSINYAYEIQQSILPDIKEIQDYISESFCLFLPKQIVSGDFYWIDVIDNKLIWAVVDCTGHGVPGSLMSILGFNGLNKIINEQKITEPSLILNHLSKHVEDSFKRSNNHEIKDGMEMGICVLNLENKELTFSGSFNPCYIISNQKMIELKAVRKQVGKNLGSNKQFESQIYQLKKEDWIIMSSDGFPDQFGGIKDIKFGYPKFRNLLLNSTLEVDPKNYLVEEFNFWKKNKEQVDDVCIVGVKI